jgi:hypothetical protein
MTKHNINAYEHCLQSELDNNTEGPGGRRMNRREDDPEMISCWRETALLSALVVASWASVAAFAAWVLL